MKFKKENASSVVVDKIDNFQYEIQKSSTWCKSLYKLPSALG